jgi:hypothetical protein
VRLENVQPENSCITNDEKEQNFACVWGDLFLKAMDDFFVTVDISVHTFLEKNGTIMVALSIRRISSGEIVVTGRGL